MSPNSLQRPVCQACLKHLSPSALLTSCLFDGMVLPCSAVQWAFQRRGYDFAPPPPADPLSGQQESPGQHSVQMLFQS